MALILKRLLGFTNIIRWQDFLVKHVTLKRTYHLFRLQTPPTIAPGFPDYRFGNPGAPETQFSPWSETEFLAQERIRTEFWPEQGNYVVRGCLPFQLTRPATHRPRLVP
jgi:hypothetical protein